MIIDNMEYVIEEEYYVKENNNIKLKIKLKGINHITNMSCMFSGCSSLTSLPDISKWNTENVEDISSMFNGCKSLKEILKQPIDTWRNLVVNDFETSVFSKYPEIAAIKDRLYDLGALFASMSGSGSAVYGIFSQPLEFVDEIFTGYFCRQRTLEV